MVVQLKHLKKILPLFEEIVIGKTTKFSSRKFWMQKHKIKQKCYAPENLLMQMLQHFLSFFFFKFKQFICPSLFCWSEENKTKKNNTENVLQKEKEKLWLKNLCFCFAIFQNFPHKKKSMTNSWNIYGLNYWIFLGNIWTFFMFSPQTNDWHFDDWPLLIKRREYMLKLNVVLNILCFSPSPLFLKMKENPQETLYLIITFFFYSF